MQGIHSTPQTKIAFDGRIAQLESELILDRATRSVTVENPLLAGQFNQVESIEYNRHANLY
jgi:hypothetical protein